MDIGRLALIAAACAFDLEKSVQEVGGCFCTAACIQIGGLLANG